MNRAADGALAVINLFRSHGQGVQRRQVDPAAGGARRLALQDAAHLTDFADLFQRDAADDGAAVGQQVDDADAGQGDQRLADGRVADAEPIRQFLRDEVGARSDPAVEHVGHQRLHDGLAAKTAANV